MFWPPKQLIKANKRREKRGLGSISPFFYFSFFFSFSYFLFYLCSKRRSSANADVRREAPNVCSVWPVYLPGKRDSDRLITLIKPVICLSSRDYSQTVGQKTRIVLFG
jgi:hypothetical protein